jgi:hypothetical protein
LELPFVRREGQPGALISGWAAPPDDTHRHSNAPGF